MSSDTSAAASVATSPEPAAETATPDDAPATRRRRPRWSLQTRLMLTVIGIVALIFAIVSVTTGAILGSDLQASLDARVDSAARQVQLFEPGLPPTERDAAQVLAAGRQAPGFLLVVRSSAGVTSGAYVDDDGDVVELSAAQIAEVASATSSAGMSTVAVPGAGAYRLVPFRAGDTIGLAGLPMSEVNSTIGTMLTTILLVTTGGLLLLAAAIAVIIRASLRPLRAVADTATRVAAMPLAQGDVSISERVPEEEADERTEIGQVGAALNTLLDHVGASLQARQQNEERMRSFVADASHELRTPLASIRGYSELSLRDPTLSDNTESALERIQAQSVRMTTLVEDLLLLARLDEGQELVYGTVDLSQAAIESVADAQAAGPGHIWHLDVGEDPVLVAGDLSRLHQVLANLLANARVHTPEGTTVTVSVARDADEAVVRVHDDGHGLDPGIAGDLFARFSRADRSRARKTGGTGLGLSIAKAIVEAHHGVIRVRSTPGDTTFEVRLPARPADPAQ